jgi:hypothetical protein
MSKKLLIFTAVALMTVSCSSSKNRSSEPFPSEYRSNFLSSCAINAEQFLTVSAAADYCQCVLESVEASMSVDEFLKAEQSMLDGEASNIDIEKLSSGCL